MFHDAKKYRRKNNGLSFERANRKPYASTNRRIGTLPRLLKLETKCQCMEALWRMATLPAQINIECLLMTLANIQT